MHIGVGGANNAHFLDKQTFYFCYNNFFFFKVRFFKESHFHPYSLILI